MDFVSLRTFCRAIEEGNLTAAAKAVHITKSVASRRIQMLEDELDTKLLVRTTKGVSATDAGALFYERAMRILAEIEDASQSVKCVGGSVVGTLRITAPRSLVDIILSKAFVEFMQTYPDLKLDLNLTDTRVDIVGNGYDVGLRVTNELSDTSLIAKKITAVNAYTVASPDYIEKYGSPEKPEDLKNHKCVLYSNMATASLWRYTKGDKPRTARVNGVLASNSGSMQLAAAKAGIAVAFLPQFYLNDALAEGRVVKILENFQHSASFLYALYPERRLLPLKVRVFIDFIAEWCTRPENKALF